MKRKYNVGDIYVNNQGESFKIINYIAEKFNTSKSNVTKIIKTYEQHI